MRRKKAPDRAATVKEETRERLAKRSALGAMFVASKAPAKKTARGISRAQAKSHVKSAETLVDERAFAKFTPRDWVGLFCWIHEAVYSVDCIEEVRREWNTAAAAASRMLSDSFEGDKSEFYLYLAWVAKNEEERENWRRRNNKPGSRLEWRGVFSRFRLLTEYRVAQARTEGVQ